MYFAHFPSERFSIMSLEIEIMLRDIDTHVYPLFGKGSIKAHLLCLWSFYGGGSGVALL